MEQSPSTILRRLESDVRRITRPLDLSKLDKIQRKALDELSQDLNDARRYLESYGLSETREEQLNYGKTARKWLVKAKKNILIASETGIFNAADVAQLTAQIDYLKDILK